MSPSATAGFIRLPSVSGHFYPSSPGDLTDLIKTYLARADVVLKKRPFGIIAPHAGYPYSGPVAGWAYRQIQGYTYDTVILIAPSHFEPFPFASIMPDGIYRTPLGDLKVDTDFAHQLVHSCSENFIRAAYNGHINPYGEFIEHALEVQLPFLQVAIKDFKIVPIVIGGREWEICHELGNAIAAVGKDRNILIVASSDLSHYHSYKTAYELDKQVIDYINRMDAEGLAKGCNSGELEACGGMPISAMLVAANDMGYDDIKILNHATSGDVPGGTKSQVVGYLAAAVYAKSAISVTQPMEKHGEENLTDAQKRYLLHRARHAVATAVGIETEIDPTGGSKIDKIADVDGLFVTLKIQRELRGCIGTLELAEPLEQALEKVAVQSAFMDPRFPRLTKDEFANISFEITLLHPMVRAKPEDVIAGMHGVMIISRGYRGLLLPQVAEERGWTSQKFLDAVCLKAGLPKHAWKEPNAVLYVFTAEHFGD